MALTSTTYPVTGMRTPSDARAIKDALATVPGIGAIATEIPADGPAVVVIKHKEEVALDRGAIETALRAAGDFHLA